MPAYYSDMVNRRTALYRIYDKAERLLYVGISLNPEVRVRQHSRHPWWAEVTEVTVEWFDGREAAKDAEWNAIADEDPVHNITRPPTDIKWREI